MFLLVGLGNPGSQYAKNRHNVGFLSVDEIHSSFGFSSDKQKHQGLLSEGFIDGEKVLSFKPLTYMNRSGQAVLEVAHFYKIPPEHIFVFHDDLELMPGKLRIKQGGGHAGHNGLRDLDAHLGKNYWRVRIGIGRPSHKGDVSHYVLHNFSKDDEKWLADLLPRMADDVNLLFSEKPLNYAAKIMNDVVQGV